MPDTLPTTTQTPTVVGTADIGPAGGLSHESHQTDFIGSASGNSNYQSAEEEKRRLAATYAQQPVSQDQASQATPVPYEAYEKETSYLEREEREQLPQAGLTSLPQRSKKSDKDDELPPYQDN